MVLEEVSNMPHNVDAIKVVTINGSSSQGIDDMISQIVSEKKSEMTVS